MLLVDTEINSFIILPGGLKIVSLRVYKAEKKMGVSQVDNSPTQARPASMQANDLRLMRLSRTNLLLNTSNQSNGQCYTVC